MIAQRLKEARIRKNWSQKELAEKSDVSFEQISRYETGKSRPHKSVIIKLAKALGVTSEYLEGITTENALKVYLMDENIRIGESKNDFLSIIDKTRNTNFSEKDKNLIKDFLELILKQKAAEDIFSK